MNVHFYGRLQGQASKEKAVGYCHSYRHKGRLSVKQVKKHGCLAKQCPRFEKYENHPWWEQRDRIKRLRKERKNGRMDS